MTQKRTVLPPIRVTEEEKETIKIMADVYGLSLSKYIRIAALARTQTLKGRAEASITVKLLKINADQARLGNLLKMAMERGHGGAETMRIIKDIRAVQDDLKEAVRLI